MLQDVAGHPRTIDERPAYALQVLEDMVVADGDDRRVLFADRRIVDHDLIIGLPADVQTLLVEKALVHDRAARAHYQLRHGSLVPLAYPNQPSKRENHRWWLASGNGFSTLARITETLSAPPLSLALWTR